MDIANMNEMAEISTAKILFQSICINSYYLDLFINSKILVNKDKIEI